jgi:GT2 family glycosyltransferase
MPFSYPKWNTFIIPVIRPDLIERCLDTIYKYTEHDTFYIYIVDQTKGGLTINRKKYPGTMLIRPPITDFHKTGNLGFSKANNLAVQLVSTPYFTMCNDDVEFINDKWWQGVLDTFSQVDKATPDRPAIIVTPSSVKLPDWSVGRKSGDDFYVLPYKEEYSDEEYNKLVNDEHYVNEHLTLKPDSVIDGITLYCSVFDTHKFLDVGYLDESYYPGGAEDYDYCCRASLKGYRCVGTTKSWVFHHWSKSLNANDKEDVKGLVQDDLRMGDHNQVWGKRFDIWGIKCTQCEERLRTTDNITAVCPKHLDEIYEIPQVKIQPL